MFIEDILTVNFIEIDDFCKRFEEELRRNLIESKAKSRNRVGLLSLSEIITIIVGFHQSGFRTFKNYYRFLLTHSKGLFPNLPSYSRFIFLKPRVILPLSMFIVGRGKSKCSGISFIDSTKLEVCGKKRMNSNKVFKEMTKIGKTTMGYFFGFKLHLVVNDQGDILNFCLSQGNTDDRKPVGKLTKGLFGKLFGDKGYISKELTSSLLDKGISLFTPIKKNMKERAISKEDKFLLRKRSIIETINDQLKNISQIEHTRHRSPFNFIVNLLGGLAAYSLKEKKPSLNLEFSPPAMF
jgi:Transposase DDE domain